MKDNVDEFSPVSISDLNVNKIFIIWLVLGAYFDKLNVDLKEDLKRIK